MGDVIASGGQITSIPRDLKGTLSINEKYNDVEVKTIASEACANGNIECLDLRNSKIQYIGGSAFSACRKLITVYFGETLRAIDSNAFLLTAIKELYIPKNLVDFTGYAFNQSPNINSIEVDSENPKLYSEGNCLFRKEDSFLIMVARNITSIKEIPDLDNIKGIDGFAFTNCMIQSFIGSEQMTALSEFSFHAMDYISLIDLSSTNITEIPAYTFYSCSAKRIILPHCIESIGEQSFVYAQKLVSLYLHYPLKNIGERSFENCTNLRSIYYFGATNFSAVNAFSQDAKTRVYVLNIYKDQLFGGLSVTRNWMRKTCYCKTQKESLIDSCIFLVVMIEK